MLSSLICSVGGVGDRGGAGVSGGNYWDGETEKVSQVQSRFLRYCAAIKSPEHFACTHPEHMLHLSFTCDVACTYGTGVLCSMT